MTDTAMAKDLLPTADDVLAAAKRLEGHVIRTPLIENASVNAQAGGRVLLKLESFQHTGSFKFRGAFNRLALLNQVKPGSKVVAFSTGNHAKAVAAAGRLFGMPVTVAMPDDTPTAKLEGTLRFGAEILTFDRRRQDGTTVARELAERNGCVFVPPFDDADIVAGQGTCALEIFDQARRMGLEVDRLLISSAGGGFAAGSCLAAKASSPSTRVWSVEADGWDGIRRSLKEGRRVTNDGAPPTICDAITCTAPGEIPLRILQENLSGTVSVTDREVREAIRLLFDELKLVAEPGGAAALAAVLSGAIDCRTGVTAVIVCSGNIDIARLASLLSA